MKRKQGKIEEENLLKALMKALANPVAKQGTILPEAGSAKTTTQLYKTRH
jgi:hypothetical protein